MMIVPYDSVRATNKGSTLLRDGKHRVRETFRG